jgi:hypothetical protein
LGTTPDLADEENEEEEGGDGNKDVPGHFLDQSAAQEIKKEKDAQPEQDPNQLLVE